MKRLISIILILVLMLSSCNAPKESDKKSDPESISSSEKENTDSSEETIAVDFSKTDTDMFTDRDYKTEYDESESISIELNGSSASASSDSVKISGGTVTITEDATHIISGTLDDGMIVVNAPESAKLQLVFNGVSITSKTSAPLYIIEADKVFLTLAGNTENTLTNGGTFTAIDDNNIDSVIFSKQDLTINGSGSLKVTSPAGHGIISKDDLVITGGSYTVNSSSHGLDANDSVRITGETSLTIDAGKDGIHAENTDDEALGFIYISNGNMKIEAEGDGIAAGAYMQINGGTFDILAGGGYQNGSKESSDSWGGFMGGGRPGDFSTTSTDDSESSTSMKGLKSANSMRISNGTFKIDSADDAVHSDVSLTVNGGSFDITSGDDAVHAEKTLTVSAGTLNISESYEGLEALNIEVKGGDIKLKTSDDGLNAAGGTDSSGMTGGRDGMFGGGKGIGRPGGMSGGMSSSSSGSIVISGGTLYINSSGDGLDANGTLTISGGHTTVVGPTQGDTATLDYDVSGVITGGTFIGTGASNMAQNFSDSEQGVIALNVGNQSAGTKITIADGDKNVIITCSPELSYQVVIISSPDLVSGKTYSVTVGSSTSEFEAS